MARLVIDAAGAAAMSVTGPAGSAGAQIAAPGNTARLPLIVSVSAADGRPVTHLAREDFSVRALLLAPGGPGVKLEWPGGVSGGRDGFYSGNLVPISSQSEPYTWAAGPYVIAVTVSNNGDHGQTLFVVRVG